PGEQCAVAQQVDQPGNAARAMVDLAQRALGEDRAVLPRDVQAVAHVLAALLGVHRAEMAPDADPLPQLAQVLGGELLLQLGLTEQHDLQQLRSLGLEVREQPQLLERLGREILRLVDDQQHAAPLAARLDEEGIEYVGELGTRFAERRQPELAVDRLEQLERRQRRIEQERHFGLRAEPPQQGAAQRRLPGADLPGDRHEPFALLDPVDEVPEHLAVRSGQVEEARIRAEREGLLVEAVVGGVHPELRRSVKRHDFSKQSVDDGESLSRATVGPAGAGVRYDRAEAISSRIWRLRILPEAFRGSGSAANSTTDGTLNAASRSRTCCWSASIVSCAPGFRWMQAATSSPSRGWGSPNTAASYTAGCS